METVLVIGYGEVGKAIACLEREAEREVSIVDLTLPEPAALGLYETVHVCIPYSEKFVDSVNAYLDKYPAPLVIIHSSVPVGTCEKIRAPRQIVHSPIRGKHPELQDGIRTFVKYVGGNRNSCKAAIKWMVKWKCKVRRIGEMRESELAKLLDTAYYGWNISFADRVKHICDKYNADFEKVYKDWNRSYNQGYSKLKMRNVVRPYLEPPFGGIGGHCVYQNALLLDEPGITNEIIRLGKKDAIVKLEDTKDGIQNM